MLSRIPSSPEPLLIEKQMYKNNQKPNDACPARTTAAMLLKMKITTSCPNIAKPHPMFTIQ